MVKKCKIIFLVLTTMGLQIKMYCAPTERSNVFKKKVDMYKTFSLSGAGYLFSPNGEKVDIDEFDGYSIGIKIFKKNFIWILTNMPHKKIENIIGYFLYFRSFFLELIKSLKFYETIFHVYHKGRHSVSRTSLFNIDCEYVFKREVLDNCYLQVNDIQKKNLEKEKTVCIICHTEFLSTDDIVGHKIDNGKNGHFNHKDCIEKWLNIKNSCPLCRKHIQKTIADELKGETLISWIDIFRLSLQSAKYTYEYAFTKNKDFHCSFRSSICPLIFSSGIPTIFFRLFSIKRYKEDNDFSFDWGQFFSWPDFIILSLCTKISVGFIFFIQNIGALFELTYIKDHYKKTYNSIEKNAAENKEKGYKFEFKITILINKDI